MAAKKSPAKAKSAVTPAFTRKPATATPEKPATNTAEQRKPAGLPVDMDDTVCVALNRPNGVYFRMPDGRRVELNGNGQPLIGRDKGILPVGAYGLTIIKAEDWEYILKHYGGMKLFTNGLCFATGNKEDSQEEAESRADLRNGLEPVNPKKTQTQEAQK